MWTFPYYLLAKQNLREFILLLSRSKVVEILKFNFLSTMMSLALPFTLFFPVCSPCFHSDCEDREGR